MRKMNDYLPSMNDRERREKTCKIPDVKRFRFSSRQFITSKEYL